MTADRGVRRWTAIAGQVVPADHRKCNADHNRRNGQPSDLRLVRVVADRRRWNAATWIVVRDPRLRRGDLAAQVVVVHRQWIGAAMIVRTQAQVAVALVDSNAVQMTVTRVMIVDPRRRADRQLCSSVGSGDDVIRCFLGVLAD